VHVEQDDVQDAFQDRLDRRLDFVGLDRDLPGAVGLPPA
jgi:hypothetical protein